MKTSGRIPKTETKPSVHSVKPKKENNSFFASGNKEGEMFFSPAILQPKLKVGKPGDKYEQEADRVADQVMRMPDKQFRQQPMDEEVEMVQLQTMEEEEELQMR